MIRGLARGRAQESGAGAARIATFGRDRSGAVAIEYGLLIMMVAIFILSISSLGDVVSKLMFDDLAATMQEANGNGG